MWRSAYFRQICASIKYLHVEKGVSHNDLKLENILVTHNTTVYLWDFGMSVRSTELGVLPELSQQGSVHYMAPECLGGAISLFKADMWALGIILFALMTGKLPFVDEYHPRLVDKIRYARIQFPDMISQDIVDQIKQLLCVEPDERLTIQEVLSHPCLSKA